MQNLLKDLTGLLSEDDRLVSDGKLLKNKVIELALKKRKSLKEAYAKEKVDINPLVLVQLPDRHT
ncbi:MAG: hypothetical protein Q7J70_06640, partial [Thermodesulfovibrionales bacterium]|nr:hypothetical protein [Thermodesulfovibrionales bacterium]